MVLTKTICSLYGTVKPIEKIVNNEGLPVDINRFFLQCRSEENRGLSPRQKGTYGSCSTEAQMFLARRVCFWQTIFGGFWKIIVKF